MPDARNTPRRSPPNNAPNIGPILLIVDSIKLGKYNWRYIKIEI